MSYSFDPTGTLLANHVNNEPHTIAGIDGISVNYALFNQGPAFYDSVEIIDSDGNALIKEQDYFGIYKYEEASSRLQKTIYGGIAYTDPTRSGTYKFNYNTIGSELVVLNNNIINDALELLNNLNNIPLESIADVPETFPLTPHSQPLDSYEGIAEILNAFEVLKTVIANKNVQIKMQDIVDLDTTFISPLLTSMADISANIENIGLASNVNVRSSHNAGTIEVYQTPTADVWHDTSLSLEVIIGGRYLLDTEIESETSWETTSGIVDTRWVVDGVPLVESTLTKAVVELSAGNIVKVQYRIRSANALEISFGNANKSSGLYLTLLNRI